MPEHVLRTMETAVKVEMRGPLELRPPGIPVLRRGERTDLSITLLKQDAKRMPRQGGVVKKLPKGIFRACFDPAGPAADCSYSGGISPGFALVLGVNYSFQVFQEALDVFFLHAASVVIGRKAFLFTAPSGGGKTTISRLADKTGIKVLGDDTCVIKRKGRKFYAAAYPLSSLPPSGQDVFEVGAVFFLKKSRHNGIMTMTLPEAIAGAMPQAMCYSMKGMAPARCPGYSKYVFGSLCSMLDSVRFGKLDFTKNGGVFSCLG